jgi:hypothetical protein
VARSAGTSQVDPRIAIMIAAPAYDPSGAAPRRKAMWVTKIINQTNSPPNSATPKNHT